LNFLVIYFFYYWFTILKPRIYKQKVEEFASEGLSEKDLKTYLKQRMNITIIINSVIITLLFVVAILVYL